MPRTRDQLETREEQEVPVGSGTHKEAVLALLAGEPDTGYTPKEIAAETPVPRNSVYPVLQRLREDGLVEKLSAHYLVAQDRINDVQDMVLTTQQLGIADDISQRATAPDTMDAPNPEALDAPTDDPTID